MVAIITGVTGQDGSYMSEFLLEKGYKVIGVVRRLSVENHQHIEHLKDNKNFIIEYADVTDQKSIDILVKKYKPDFFYNFAANSFVGKSWDMPYNHMETNCLSVINQLESIREHCPNCKYYNAGSSEEFGNVLFSPQNESHPAHPRSPYGASKVAARNIVKVYRESYGLYAIQGYLFNHESPRRGKEFVSRKICEGIKIILNQIKNKEKISPIILGNLDAKRDWSHAKDFVEGIFLMTNQERYNKALANLSKEDVLKNLQEYVLASGETNSVRTFVEKAFKKCGIIGSWQLNFDNTESFLTKYGDLVVTDEKFYRPAEVDLLVGDSSKARKELGWKPKYNLDSLIEDMLYGAK